MQGEQMVRTCVRIGSGPQRRRRSIYVRRRFAVAFVLLALATGIHAATAAANTPQRFRTVVAMPGDTLWSLWARYGAQTDPRLWVFSVEHLNRMTSDGLMVGERLRLPAP